MRRPPRLPRPATPHRSLRTPPEPGITSPASGFTISDCCNVPYSSSVRYCCTNFREQLRFDERQHADHTSLTDYGIDGTARSDRGNCSLRRRRPPVGSQQVVGLKELGGGVTQFSAAW